MCSIRGYAEIGARLLSNPQTKLAGNPYRDWIELHGGQEFQDGADAVRCYIDRVAKRRRVKPEDTSNERCPSLKVRGTAEVAG